MNDRQRDDLLVWLDLEMSGLDPTTERIIEIAVVVTDGQLEVIDPGIDLVVHQPDSLLDAMDDWNRQHHGESGLTDQVRASTTDEAQAEATVLELITKHCAARCAPLAGNSVHQDRAFLQRYMPRLESYLHYRNVDVSTVKELVRRWSPATFESRPAKKGAHRALDDIHESIAELSYYRSAAFRI